MGNIVRKLPIGIQSFDKLRTENYLYVDKTEFIYQMAYQGVPYFLSRPRRFGKKLAAIDIQGLFRGEERIVPGISHRETRDRVERASGTSFQPQRRVVR